MDKIAISNITKITKDKIYYRDDEGIIVFIELEACANSYEATHNRKTNDKIKVQCVGVRFFGEYAYYELYTAVHTQLYMNLKTSKFKQFISKITGWNLYSKDFKMFNSIQKQLNANGWTTLDLS